MPPPMMDRGPGFRAGYLRGFPTLPDLLLLLWIAALSCFLVVMAGSRLGDFPNVSGDDAWIMSASHKLAHTGVFGSDLYRGFGNAERHYFIALPVYHGFQAAVLSSAGTSVAAARSVTLASGLVALWCTAWLARRWHGVAVAAVATGLLVVWRAYLLGLASGLSFISVARTGRYDATALALVLLTIVGLDLLLARERRALALGVGLAAGLATLTQFFGAFTVAFILSVLLVERGRRFYRLRMARWIAAGWFLVVLPYIVYAGVYWSDFKRQSELKALRMSFDSPGFYLDNLRDEPERYRLLFDFIRPLLDGRYHRFDQPLSPFLFGIAIMPALALLAGRLFRAPTPGERRLGLAMLVFGLSLALVDATNAPLYAVALLPFFCIAIALLIVIALAWAVQRRSLVTGVALAVLVITPVVIVGREGVAAHRREHAWSQQIVAYEDVAAQVDTLLPTGEPVLGSERWWAGLYSSHDYVALSALTFQMEESDGPGRFSALLAAYEISAIVVDDSARGVVQQLPEPLRAQVESVLDNHASHAGTVSMHPYGQIDIYLLELAAGS